MPERSPNRLRRDRRGTVAIITAIVIFPLLFLAIGVPIDIARVVQLRSALQNFDDSAAIAGQVDIANGATANQACTLVYTMGAALIFAPGSGLGNFGATAATSPGVTCGAAPQTNPATAPDTVTVTGASTLPMTFTSFLKSSIPVSTSSTAMGPQGFITICVTPQASGSSDLNQAFYYFRNPDGTFSNQDGTPINPADYPGLSTGPGSSILGSGTGVELSAFLVDNASPPNGPVAGNGYCDSADTQVKVTIKNGLGQRLGFEFVNVTGGHYPCYYGAHSQAMSCLLNNANYNYNPYSSSSALTGGNANGFLNYYLLYGTPLKFTSNAYGSFIGEENLFYSTDYPSSYATNNQNTGIISGASLVSSPVADNSCYETLPLLGAVSPTFNGYSPASQGCLLSQSPANAVARGYGAAPDGTVTFAFNQSQTGILACLAQDGSTRLNGTAYTPTTVSGTGEPYAYQYVTGTNASSNVQQQNMILANSSTTSPSLGSSVYKCPVNTIGNPYYPDPTCAELKGSTLLVGWNDMGGFESDNGTGPSDLSYQYSCQPPVAGALTETALTQ
jgi:Flp pilus assembly protein TadG